MSKKFLIAAVLAVPIAVVRWQPFLHTTDVLRVAPFNVFDNLVRSIGSIPKGTDLLFGGALLLIVAIVLKRVTVEADAAPPVPASTTASTGPSIKPVMVPRRDAAA